MSQYLPEVAWSTIASNVSLGLTTYRYYITVNPLDPNEAGASTMSMAVNDWFIDFAGYPFLIEEINGSILTVYDILERGDGTTSAYGPYANKLGYVYRPLNGAIILTQAQLRKLDASAADIIQPIEKGIVWKYRGLELNDGVVNKSNITSLELSGLTLTDNTEDGWQGGSKLALDASLVGLSDVYGTPTDQYVPKWIEANNRFEFAAVSGGSSQWVTSGSDIYYNGGNVGIGTTSPSYTLDVNGTARIGTLNGLIYGTSGVLSGLSGTGFVKSSGTTITFDNSTYQPSDATLTSLATVAGVQGDLLYASGTDTWTRLAKSTTANSFLKNSGTNNNPVWSTISTSEVLEGTNLYFTNARAIAALLTGYTATSGTISATDSILQAIQKLGFDKHVAVTLAANNGLSLTGQVLAMGTPSNITHSSTNSVTTNTHTHAITAGLGFIGNGSAQYQVPVTGATPFTPTWTTATKIFGTTGLNSLTYASTAFVKMTGTNTFSLDTNTYLTANQTITLSGAVTGSGTTAITTSLATPATITGSTTNTGGTGAHTHAISLSFDNLTDVVLTTPTQGSVLYFNGTNWVNLAPGTNGYFLKTQGAGANPVWAASTGGGTPGGGEGDIQFNSSSNFAGTSEIQIIETEIPSYATYYLKTKALLIGSVGSGGVLDYLSGYIGLRPDGNSVYRVKLDNNANASEFLNGIKVGSSSFHQLAWDGTNLKLGLFGTSPVVKTSVTDPAAVATTETADATYSTNEVNMLNNLKTDVTNLRSKLTALIDALQSYGLI